MGNKQGIPGNKSSSQSSSSAPSPVAASSNPNQNPNAARGAATQPEVVHPLVQERATQELAAMMVIQENKDLVSKIIYGIDNDGDFAMVLKCGSRGDHRFCVVVKIENQESLTWQESRAIRAAVKFGERFTLLNDVEFKRWSDHMRSQDNGDVSFQTYPDKSVILITPKTAGRVFGPGKIAQMKVSVDKDQDLLVEFQTDMEKYSVVINHTVRDESFADLESQAFADVVHIAEPGDKMDDQIFMHYCAQLRNKFHMLKIVRINDVLTVHIVPTKLTVAETGIAFDSTVTLPPMADGNADWSDATKARVAAIENSSNDTTILQHMLQSASLGNTDGSTPLVAERAREEAAIQAAVLQRKELIAKTYYGFDTDGDFSVILNAANKMDFRYILSVKIADRDSLTWKECRAMRDILNFGERGTKIAVSDFMAWVDILKGKHKDAKLINGDNQMCILVTPEPAGRNATPGKSRALQLKVDSDNDFVVLFETDVQKYQIIVNHDNRDSTFSILQGKALVDALLVGEPGDKMDDHMFLQYCASIKAKFHLVKVQRKPDTMVAYIVPTTLDESSAGVNFTSEVTIPARVDPIEWSPETAYRVSLLHVGVNCDVCGKQNFAGRRYKCKQCDDYDLCQDCFSSSRVSGQHLTSHSVQPMDPPGASTPAPVQQPSEPCHINVVCDVCRKENFTGRRYKCMECHDYDLCHDCFISSRVSGTHSSDHAVKPINPPAVAVSSLPTPPPGLAKSAPPPGLGLPPTPGLGAAPPGLPPGLAAHHAPSPGNQNANG
jgi:hypothetical protein